MPPSLSALDHLVLTCADIGQSIRFYRDILGMTDQSFQAADGTRRHALGFGAQKINLHPAGGEFRPHAARPTPGTADLCFLSPTPLAEWQAHLTGHGIAILEGPVRRTGATGPITSLYIRDPDGNLVEIATPS